MGFDLTLLSAWLCVVKDHRGSYMRTYMPVNRRNGYDTLTHRVRSMIGLSYERPILGNNLKAQSEMQCFSYEKHCAFHEKHRIS